MKFVDFVKKLRVENEILKVVTIGLTLVVVLFAVVLGMVADKAPIVVERGCITKSADLAKSAAPTEVEFKSFLEKALSQRFDSNSVGMELLAPEEQKTRELEGSELKKRDIRQKVLIEEVKISKEEIRVDALRVLSVKDIRSALPLQIIAKVETTSRSDANPFGLILVNVTPIKSDKDAKAGDK